MAIGQSTQVSTTKSVPGGREQWHSIGIAVSITTAVIFLVISMYIVYRLRKQRGPIWAAKCPVPKSRSEEVRVSRKKRKGSSSDPEDMSQQASSADFSTGLSYRKYAKMSPRGVINTKSSTSGFMSGSKSGGSKSVSKSASGKSKTVSIMNISNVSAMGASKKGKSNLPSPKSSLKKMSIGKK